VSNGCKCRSPLRAGGSCQRSPNALAGFEGQLFGGGKREGKGREGKGKRKGRKWRERLEEKNSPRNRFLVTASSVALLLLLLLLLSTKMINVA